VARTGALLAMMASVRVLFAGAPELDVVLGGRRTKATAVGSTGLRTAKMIPPSPQSTPKRVLQVERLLVH
jgi:hypothetical protein